MPSCLIGDSAAENINLDMLPDRAASMLCLFWGCTVETKTKSGRQLLNFCRIGLKPPDLPMISHNAYIFDDFSSQNFIISRLVKLFTTFKFASKQVQHLEERSIYKIISKNKGCSNRTANVFHAVLLKSKSYPALLNQQSTYNNKLEILIMSKSKQNQVKKQVVDYNYVNNIFCSVLSTLQSLKLISQNRHQQMYIHKLFTSYDKVDYSKKNELELQSQLQTHLIIFKASLQSYAQQYKNNWVPPSNFNRQKAQQFTLDIAKFFEQNNNLTSAKLAKDLVQLLRGQTQNLYIDSVSIKGVYSEAQQIANRTNLMINSIKAQSLMEQEQDRMQEQKIENINQLKVTLNPNYQFPIYYRYLLVTKDYYEQQLQDNVGFQLALLEQCRLYEDKEEAKSERKKTKRKQNYNELVIQLQVCHQTVMRINVVV